MSADQDWKSEWEAPGDGGDGDGGSGLPEFLLDPLGVIRRRWLWMALVLLLGIGAAAGVGLSQRLTYVAEGTVLITSQVIPEDFVRSTVREDSLSHINAIVGQVVSRQNLGKLVERFDLYPSDGGRDAVRDPVTEMREDVAIYPRDDLDRGARQRFSTSQVYVISYEAPDPEIAASVVNELAGFFTAANIAMRNQQAELATRFLRRELERAEKALREQDRVVTEFLQEHRGGLPSELTTNLARLERLQAQRQSLATQIDAAEGRVILLRAEEGAQDDDTSPTPQDRLLELQDELRARLAVLTEEHPNVLALRRQIESLEAQLAAADAPESPEARERAARLAEEQRQLGLLRSQLAETGEQIAAIDERVQKTPIRTEQLSALQERAGVLRENYLEFLRKVQEAELAQSLESAQQGARVSVLDRAMPPTSPKRARWKILFLGVVAAFGASVAVGILLELVDPVVVNSRQLESIVERPVLGSIPTIS